MLTLPVYAQTSVIDSLEQAYAKAKTDPDRIHILKNISWEYLNNRYDSELAKQYIDSVHSLSKKTGDAHGIALANYQYAVLERQEGNYDRALSFIEPYLEFSLKEEDQFAYANGLYQKALIMDDKGDYEKSLELYLRILRIYEERQDEFSIGFTLNAIGETLQKTGKISQAMGNYIRALKIFSRLDEKGDMANANFNIGDTHLHLEAYDSALIYFNRALELDKEIKSLWGMAFDYESIGKVYEALNDPNQALIYHQSALKIRQDLGLKRELSLSYTALGSLNGKLRNYKVAEEQLLKAVQISEEIGAKTEIRKNYEALSELYEDRGDFEKALEFKNKYVIINDSLYNESKSQQIEELQVRFDSEKQQAEIDALEKDAVISDLKIKRQTTLRNITIGVAMSAILLLFALFNRYKYRQRVRQEDEEKKRLLENEKRKTELEKKRVDELKKIDKLKDEFLANTSHELRTPLHGIIGLAESLKDGAAGKLTAKAKDNLNMITNSGKRLSHLINDILDFSKLKNKDLILARRPIDLYPISQVILRLSEPLVDGKSLQLINEIDPDLPLIDADENRLQQILHNLIGNAIKFTREGTIKLKARRLDASMEIKVSDTGIGIEEDKFETIFNSFQQGDGSTVREYGGTGLGLSVTRQLVELHGGRIFVKSKVGEGSEFIFTIPLSDTKREKFKGSTETELEALNSLAAEVKTYEKESLKQSPENKGKRILIVDDEPVNRRVLQNHLNLAGYSIEEANNGQEALLLIENSPPFDLVLLDIMMPGMSGFEVCEKIRINYLTSELPVVMLTAKNRVSDLVTGFGAGANDYLTKPFSKKRIIESYKSVCH